MVNNIEIDQKLVVACGKSCPDLDEIKEMEKKA